MDDKIKRTFLDFLSKQGITIEFFMSLKPQYTSIDKYFEVCDSLNIPPSNFILQAFDWETNHPLDFELQVFNLQGIKCGESGFSFWRYHNKCWCDFLEESTFKIKEKVDK